MKLFELKFSRGGFYCCWNGLHRKTVRRFWNVPVDVDLIWLVAHDRPAAERVRVQLHRVRHSSTWVFSSPAFRCCMGPKPNDNFGYRSRAIIRALKPRLDINPTFQKRVTCTVYVECWYEKQECPKTKGSE